jgi:hypothetical protein
MGVAPVSAAELHAILTPCPLSFPAEGAGKERGVPWLAATGAVLPFPASFARKGPGDGVQFGGWGTTQK